MAKNCYLCFSKPNKLTPTMKNPLIIFCAAALFFSISSCEKTDDDPIRTRIFQLTVASETKQNAWHPYGDGWGFTPTSFWVKEAGDTQWNPFSAAIDGFEWEEGYEYTLTVKSVLDTRIADAGPDYTLLSEDSKVQKQSVVPTPKTHKIKNMTVASQKYTPSAGEFPQWYDGSLYVVKYDYSGFSSGRANLSPPVSDWRPFYGEIEGFDYVEGIEYKIDISYDDETNWRGYDQLPLYRLDDIVSETPDIP